MVESSFNECLNYLLEPLHIDARADYLITSLCSVLLRSIKFVILQDSSNTD